jgi:hypothetical protein
MGKIQARLSELQLEKMARVRDKVIATITSEGLDYAELMDHTAFARRKKSGSKRGKVAPKYRKSRRSLADLVRSRSPAAMVQGCAEERQDGAVASDSVIALVFDFI